MYVAHNNVTCTVNINDVYYIVVSNNKIIIDSVFEVLAQSGDL